MVFLVNKFVLLLQVKDQTSKFCVNLIILVVLCKLATQMFALNNDSESHMR
jgi:hypothetical protein